MQHCLWRGVEHAVLKVRFDRVVQCECCNGTKSPIVQSLANYPGVEIYEIRQREIGCSETPSIDHRPNRHTNANYHPSREKVQLLLTHPKLIGSVEVILSEVYEI